MANQNQEAMKTPNAHLAIPLTCAIFLWSSSAYTQQFFKGADKDKGSDSSLSVLKNFGTMTYIPEDCNAPWDFPGWYTLYHDEMETPCPKDSVLYYHGQELGYRSYLQYNDAIQLTEVIWQTRFSSGWRNAARHRFVYDLEGRLIQESREPWAGTDWGNDYLIDHSYDENGRPLIISKRLHFDGALQYTERLLHSYDGDDRLSGLTEQYYNDGTWSDYLYYIYTYDSLGCLAEEEVGNWVQGLVVPYTRKLFTYDSIQRIVSMTMDMFWEDGQWNPYQRYEYAYGTNPSSMNVAYLQWGTDDWGPFVETEVVFDDDGNILSELISYWDSQYQVFVPRYNLTYAHDANGTMTSKLIRKNMDYPLVYWRNSDWYLAEFDELGNRTLVSSYLGDELEWIHIEDAVSYFDCSILDIQESPLTDALSIFPNPTTSGFHVRLERGMLQSVRLTDALGRTVKEIAANGNASFIGTDGLSSGLYIATVVTQDGSVARRVVVE